MRLTTALVLAATLLFPAAASAQPDAHAAATCSDYSNQADAQRAADTRDADGDGVYCESLPCPCLKPGSSNGTRHHTTHRRRTPAVRCGEERWNVKTLQDQRASRIDNDPEGATVDKLRGLTPPFIGTHTPRVLGVETTTYRLRVQLVAFKFEEDSDIHLVVASPKNRTHTMIAEFPNSGCTKHASSTKRRAMSNARAALIRACGTPGRSRFRTLHGSATLTGVGFYDLLHRQRGVAPNGIELHPVLKATIRSCR